MKGILWCHWWRFYCRAHQHCVVSVSCCTMFGILGVMAPSPYIRPWPKYDICRGVRFGELGGHCFLWINFVDNSRVDIVERHVFSVLSPMHLAGAAGPSSCSCLQFQLLFAKTLTLKLRYSGIIVVPIKAGITFVEINENLLTQN